MTERRPSRRVTITDVARAAGVSTTAVSWALNDKGTLDPRTRERIKARARDLGYRPSARARRFQAGRAQTIALIGTMPPAVVGGAARLGFFTEIAMAAARAALDRDYALVLVPPMDDDRFADRLDIDGALVIEPVRGHWAGEWLAGRGLPAVSIGRDPTPGSAMAWVDRHPSGADAVLDHLAERGAREIAVIVSERQRSTTEDVSAFCAQWAERRHVRVRVARADEHGGERAGEGVTRELLEACPGVDAVYAPIDAFAVGALQAAAGAGRRVPGEVMVATNYDGDRARGCVPPLTALDLRLGELAEQGITLLLDRIEGRARQVSVPGPRPRLVPRASTDR